MNITTLTAAVGRFPLLGRPRPACPPLAERVSEITQMTRRAEAQGADGMAEAAHALNKAALLASDCGLADLARDLCWQHIDIYRVADPPLTVLQARYMLEPVLNLARLHIRADVGGQALRLLEAMYQSAMANTDLIVDGHTLPLAGLTGTRQEHHKLCEWVWLHYLGDGIRALTLAGRWDEAVAHAEAHRGIGLHLMEGRQALIIAHCLNGEQSTARAVLEQSTVTQQWECQVASCLRVICEDANGASVHQGITAMARHFFEQASIPGYAFFRARLGLTIVTLAQSVDENITERVLAQTVAEVIEAGDGYAAREAHGYLSSLPGRPQVEALSKLVKCAGLGAGTLPTPLLDSITSSVETAKEALARSMLRPNRPAARA